MKIRKIVFDDCRAVGSCHYHCWQETYRGLIPDSYLDRMNEQANQQRFEKMFETQGKYQYVLEEANQIIGFFDVSKPREHYADYKVQGLYLRKAYHGNGYGRDVMDFIRSVCQGHPFYLWCLKGNPTSGYYEHMGGKMIDRRVVHIDDVVLDEVCYLFE